MEEVIRFDRSFLTYKSNDYLNTYCIRGNDDYKLISNLKKNINWIIVQQKGSIRQHWLMKNFQGVIQNSKFK